MPCHSAVSMLLQDRRPVKPSLIPQTLHWSRCSPLGATFQMARSTGAKTLSTQSTAVCPAVPGTGSGILFMLSWCPQN